MTRLYNARLTNSINDILSEPNHINVGMNLLKQRLYDTARTKFITYRTINPMCSVHLVYTSRRFTIPEKYRLSFTRLRLSSHDLRIETGRWARIPCDRRLCPCGDIQDEKHVLLDCPLSQTIRDTYADLDVSFPDIFNVDNPNSFKMIHEVLELYRRN